MHEDNEIKILRELGKLASKVDLLADAHHAHYQMTKRTLDHVLNQGARSSRHASRIRKLEIAAEESPAVLYTADRSEITGTHEFAALKAKVEGEEERRRDSGIWWKRQRWTWAMAAAGAVLLATLSGCITYVVSHAH